MVKKQTSSTRYWEKRRELEDKARLKMEQETLHSLTKNLPDALKKIQSKLLSQADLHNMTQAELLEDYSLRDQKKYRRYIDDNYKELMKSDEKYQEFIDEYFPSYDHAKVNRLLQIRTDIFNILATEMIKTDPNKKFNDGLEEIINKTYTSNSNALMYLLGPGDFNPLPKKELENMLNYPWSGKTFSNRLWGNISRLEQNLSNAIVNSVASGQGVAEVLKTMKNDDRILGMFKLEGDKFKNAIDNLVRTEYAHFAVEGLRKSMSDAGIKETQNWSAEDERVCSICGGRHGKLITDDWYPPYHGRCRCTVIPKMPELDEDIDRLYDEMFGDLLDEFAKDKFGVKLNKSKVNKASNNINKMLSSIDMKSAKLNDIISLGRAFNEEQRVSEMLGNKDKLKKAFSKYRDIGGKIPEKSWYTRSNKVVKAQLQEAFSHYPKDWVDLIEKNNQKIYAGKTNRGFFSSQLVNSSGRKFLKGARAGDGISIYADGERKTTAYHEIGHMVEHFNKDMLRISREFIAKRTKGESSTKLDDIFPGFGYSFNEVTKKDNFISPYIGKEYENASEVLSMGLESIFEPGQGQLTSIDKNGSPIYRKISSDSEFLNLIIGMILKG